MSVGHPWRRRVHVSAVIFFGLLMAAPFYWMIINSFKSGQEVAAYPPTWWPTEWHFENISAALVYLDSAAIVNSVIFTLAVTLSQLILVVMTGFAFAKMQFLGKNALFTMFVITIFVPFQVVLIPTFILVRNLNWIDTFWGSSSRWWRRPASASSFSASSTSRCPMKSWMPPRLTAPIGARCSRASCCRSPARRSRPIRR